MIKKTANSRSTIISPVRKIPAEEIEHRNPAIIVVKKLFVIINVNNAANTGIHTPTRTWDQRTETGAVPKYSKRA